MNLMAAIKQGGKKYDGGNISVDLGISAVFIVVGFLAGSFLGAFIGACFAWVIWLLKDIRDLLEAQESKNNKP